MKKYYKKLILIISIVLILIITACNDSKSPVIETKPLEDAEDKTNDKSPKTDPVIELTTDLNGDTSPKMDAFLKMITPDSTTADLKSYIEENIQYVSKKEAEKMIEFLLIYQTETIADFEITEEFFKQVYHELDESLVENISDENLKAAYRLLLDSSLIIKFNENHAYVDRDWKSLKKFSPYLPEDYEKIFDLYVKISNYEYNSERLNIEPLIEDLIKTENITNNDSSSYFMKIRNELYEAQIYNLLLGPEGNHMYFWSDKKCQEYRQLIGLSKEHPESMFSIIVNEMDKADIEEISDGLEIFNKYLTFGLESNKYLETLNYEDSEGEYEILQIKIPDNKEKEKKINKVIKDNIKDYIQEENIEDNLYLSTDLKYADEKYISYEIFLSYSDSEANEENKYFYKTLDYLEEKYINLEEYLGANFDSIKPELERIIDDKIDTYPDFVLFPDEIHLISYNQNGENAFLNLKDLLVFKD